MTRERFFGIAHREDDWWVVTVLGVGATQVKEIDDAEDMARDLIAAVRDVDPPSFDVEVVW